MKKTLLTIAGALGLMFAAQAQVVEGEVTMGPNYIYNVFYNLETGEDTGTTYGSSDWDLAFYVGFYMDKGVKINNSKNYTVYEFGSIANDWSSLGDPTTGIETWNKLYNSSTDYTKGAFDNGSQTGTQLDYGWGVYNPSNHTVVGTRAFVLNLGDDYTKFRIDLHNGVAGQYTITYSFWDGTQWGEDIQKVLNFSDAEGKHLLHFSLETEEVVSGEPVRTDWDLQFTKYNDLYGTVPNQNVTGVVTNPDVKVAKTTESEVSVNDLSEDMNVIGSADWKFLNYQTFQWETDPTINYFVKRNDSDVVYKINFTEFAGQSTGIVKFNVDNTATLSVQEVAKGVSFDVYPNPSVDKIVNVVYDIETSSSAANSIRIYSLTGAEVYKTEANSNFGFYTQTLDLSRLSSGMYLLEFRSGDKSQMKKIILK